MTTEVREKIVFFLGGVMAFFLLTECLLPSMTFSRQKKPLPTNTSWSMWASPAQGVFSRHHIHSRLQTPRDSKHPVPTSYGASCSVSLLTQANWANGQLLTSQTPFSSCWGRKDWSVFTFTKGAFVVLELSLLIFHFSTTLSYFYYSFWLP